MAVINLQTISPINIFNQRWPSDCPKSLQVTLDFAAANQWDINTLLLQTKDFIEGIQSCYYDNSQSADNFTFICPDTGFSTFFRARWQGYRPLIIANNQLNGSFNGVSGVAKVILMNTPVQPLEWSTV